MIVRSLGAAGHMIGSVLAIMALMLTGCARPASSVRLERVGDYALDTAIVRAVLLKIASEPGPVVRVDPRPVNDQPVETLPTPRQAGFATIPPFALEMRKAVIASSQLSTTDAALDEQCHGALVPLDPAQTARTSTCPAQRFRSVSISIAKRLGSDSASALVVTHYLTPGGRSTSGSRYIFARKGSAWQFITTTSRYFIE